ncbi:hypothetical protein QYE76_058332 [Lolium multiflorum]|uniref:Protein FAR1-RELATED SEQUENCE n=1 Tax=Lolium multiflorum TaxID=4521 RepID=A0AAD8T6Y1_LOLMU|nr:hypothetical protein QYE76_058332 [Lolium multiflorum]
MELQAAAVELREKEAARLASLRMPTNPPDPQSAWEEAQWSPWPESPAHSSRNSVSPPGGVIDAHAQEDGDEVMDPEYAPGVLDLNEPIPEDVSVFDDLQKEHTPLNTTRTASNADVTRSFEQNKPASGSNIGASSGQSKHASGSNIGASAGTDPITGETLSTDDSGGDDDDEVQSTPVSQTEVQTPYPGMIFDSWDEAKMHYNRYAKKIGFSIKCSTSKNSTIDGQKDKQMFVCNKNGKNEDINMQEAAPVSMIKKFSLKKYLRSHKGIPKEERDFVKLFHKVNLSAGRVMRIMGEVYGGLANVPYDAKSVSNFMATINEDQTHKDMSKLLSHFAKIKKEDPDFYFNLHTDHADKVDRIFWVDGPAIAAYKNYSDCLSFDTTYMTNMYNMPFAPFIGINRYCQSIQLGCGFLKNENVESFEWLFQEFLEAMGGLQPQNFITDQDAAMRSAILAVFPNCCHRNCRWHIMQNAQAVLGNFLSKHEELRQELNAIIDYSMSVDEFETREIHTRQVESTGGNSCGGKMDLPKQPVGRKMNNKERQQLRYGTLCNDYTRVARVASTSEKGKAIADKYMLALEKELLEMKASESAKRKKKKQAAPSSDEEPDVENVGDDGQGNSSKFDHVEDPVYIAKQGRPAEKRKKSGLHLKATKVVKCDTSPTYR